jgi:hypothetical protein
MADRDVHGTGALRRISATGLHLTLAAWLALSLALAELAPRRFSLLFQEDGVAEWLTFAAFALAAWQLSSVARVKTEPPLTRLACLGLTLFCVFVAGEEISWGQRLIGYRPPTVFLEHNHQQEANLHNLLKGLLETRTMVALVAGLYGVLASYLAHVQLVPRALAPSARLIPYFAAVVWLEVSYPFELVGELAEMMLGALFLADAAERHGRLALSEPSPLRVLSPARALWGALCAALVLVPMNDALWSLHSEEAERATRAELAQLAELVERGTGERLAQKRHVHKRLYTAVKSGYLDLDTREFYLDPWNNPYWVAYVRGGDGADGVIVLYSFGANRRRDSLIPDDGSAPVLAGDDLAVEVSPSRLRAAR